LKKRNMERNSFFLAGFLEEFPGIAGTGITKKGNPKRNAQPRLRGVGQMREIANV
jgi:hypothetical protein